jgi:hypothetical protein
MYLVARCGFILAALCRPCSMVVTTPALEVLVREGRWPLAASPYHQERK